MNFSVDELRSIMTELWKWDDVQFMLIESICEGDCEFDDVERAKQVIEAFIGGTNPT